MADIAAFMHEVEVQQGFVSRKNDGRGIERIRQLAYKLQGLPADKDKEVCAQWNGKAAFLWGTQAGQYSYLQWRRVVWQGKRQ